MRMAHSSIQTHLDVAKRNLSAFQQLRGNKWADLVLKPVFIVKPNWKLLIFDGHATHSTIPSLKKLEELKFKIFCLPSNSTHLLQPLDLAVFKSFKASWSYYCHEHETKSCHRPRMGLNTMYLFPIVGLPMVIPLNNILIKTNNIF